MRKIDKLASNSPETLEKFRWKNPSARYQDVEHDIRVAIRESCAKEQFYLCAYCCQELSGGRQDTNNEHIVPQSNAPNLSLDFMNIVASCNGGSVRHCNNARGNKILELTPLMDECETEIEYLLSGEVRGTTERAYEAVDVLNLGVSYEANPKLVMLRKQVVDAVLYDVGLKNNDDTELGSDDVSGLEDEDILTILTEELATYKFPDNGKLPSFAPVIINVLKSQFGIR